MEEALLIRSFEALAADGLHGFPPMTHWEDSAHGRIEMRRAPLKSAFAAPSRTVRVRIAPCLRFCGPTGLYFTHIDSLGNKDRREAPIDLGDFAGEVGGC